MMKKFPIKKRKQKRIKLLLLKKRTKLTLKEKKVFFKRKYTRLFNSQKRKLKKKKLIRLPHRQITQITEKRRVEQHYATEVLINFMPHAGIRGRRVAQELHEQWFKRYFGNKIPYKKNNFEILFLGFFLYKFYYAWYGRDIIPNWYFIGLNIEKRRIIDQQYAMKFNYYKKGFSDWFQIIYPIFTQCPKTLINISEARQFFYAKAKQTF